MDGVWIDPVIAQLMMTLVKALPQKFAGDDDLANLGSTGANLQQLRRAIEPVDLRFAHIAGTAEI